ncbi:hypothetical protein BT96DRAFT_148984 [Gymnopus androsaceus JB14]|uniref:G-protein coupled receptors family 3 profile domain-containing protein n=1 Tax=Gymnopus androsaceus JB14 TaxID=1447944 RepID=A0A6A4I9A6_9AGAR|nr:hypothetical protein BT96DRAFT_148984 [Gymnopus androsaceus JB14]
MTGKSVAFNVIEIIGLVGALIIIFTAVFSPSIQRLPTWYLLLCSSAAYSFSMLLLAMAHKQFGAEPDFALCLVQGTLIYACPIWLMASVCAFALQFHLAVLFYIKKYSGSISHESKWIPLSAVIVFIGVAGILLVGIVQPQIVQRDSEHFYCHFTHNIGTYIAGALIVAFAITAFTFQYNQSNGTCSINVMVRLAAYSLVSILSMFTSTLNVLPNVKNFDDIILSYSTVTVAGVFVLGINMSIIRAWMFWKDDTTAGRDIQVKVERSSNTSAV